MRTMTSPQAFNAPHRNAIDEIDAEILRLLNKRAGHAHAIGELKGTGAVYRPERENRRKISASISSMALRCGKSCSSMDKDISTSPFVIHSSI